MKIDGGLFVRCSWTSRILDIFTLHIPMLDVFTLDVFVLDIFVIYAHTHAGRVHAVPIYLFSRDGYYLFSRIKQRLGAPARRWLVYTCVFPGRIHAVLVDAGHIFIKQRLGAAAVYTIFMMEDFMGDQELLELLVFPLGAG